MGKHKFPSVLRGAGLEIEIHDGHFAQDVEDVDWIPKVAEKDWIIVTFDKKIRLKPHEKEAIISSKARMICLSSGKSDIEEVARNFVISIAKIQRFIEGNSAPFIVVLSRPPQSAKRYKFSKPEAGELRRIYPKLGTQR